LYTADESDVCEAQCVKSCRQSFTFCLYWRCS